MKFLVLVIITTWSFGTPILYPVQKQIVSSPEKAAMLIYESEKNDICTADCNQYKYELYEIDIEKKTIKEIKIPKLTFSASKSQGEISKQKPEE